MKKLLCLLCAILIISSLVACNSNEENNSSYGVETNVSHQEQLTENSTEMIEPDLLDTKGKDAVENGETTKDDIQIFHQFIRIAETKSAVTKSCSDFL